MDRLLQFWHIWGNIYPLFQQISLNESSHDHDMVISWSGTYSWNISIILAPECPRRFLGLNFTVVTRHSLAVITGFAWRENGTKSIPYSRGPLSKIKLRTCFRPCHFKAQQLSSLCLKLHKTLHCDLGLSYLYFVKFIDQSIKKWLFYGGNMDRPAAYDGSRKI